MRTNGLRYGISRYMEKRTIQQNKSLHKSFELWADTLNGAGLNMRVVLKPTVEIQWTPEMIKEYLWRSVQKVQVGKKSTTELTTKEVDQIYQTLRHHFAEKYGIDLPFASIESIIDEHEIL